MRLAVSQRALRSSAQGGHRIGRRHALTASSHFRVTRVDLAPQTSGMTPSVILSRGNDISAEHVCSGVPSGHYQLSKVSENVVHLLATARPAEGGGAPDIRCTLTGDGVLTCHGHLSPLDMQNEGSTSWVVHIHNVLDDAGDVQPDIAALPTPHADVEGDFVEREEWTHHEHSVGRVRRTVPAVVNCSLNLKHDGLVCQGLPTGDYLMKSVPDEVVHAGADAHVGEVDALGRLIIPEDPLNKDSEIKARMTESGVLLVSGLPTIPGISEPAVRARLVHVENLETLCTSEDAEIDQTVMHCPLHGIVGVPGVIRHRKDRHTADTFRTSLYDDESLGLALHLTPIAHPHGHATRTDPIIHLDN